MATSRRVLLSCLLLGSLVVDLCSGQITGPLRGSLPVSQRRFNRVVPFQAFQRTWLPLPAEPRKKRLREPEISVLGNVPATGPAGTNYVQDPATISRRAEIPPLILADFPAIPKTESFPPDPVIAAGPNHVVTAANREIRIFQKDGTLLEAVHASDWFDAVAPGCLPFDPRVLYDHFAGRFVMLWHHYAWKPDVSYYLLSISDTDDPTGRWTSWALPGDVNGSTPSGTWADNGCLGLDSLALYIVSNQYTYGTMDAKDVRIRILPKQNLYWPQPGGEVLWTDFVLGSAFCVRPAVVYGQSSAYYLLEAQNPLPVLLSVVLYRIDHPLTNPVLSYSFVPVTEYFRAPDARQPRVDSPFDVRKSYLHSEVVLVNGELHAVHSVANPSSMNTSAIRYLRINTATGMTTQDVTFGAPGYWYFYPAVAVDREGNAVITFARSSLTEYAGCYMTWRYADDGPILRPSTLIQPGFAEYTQLDGYRANRWGDYSGAAIDPVDRQTFWLMGEYAEGPNIWGTWVKSVRVVPFPSPRLVSASRCVDFGFADAGGMPAQRGLTLRNGGSPPLTVSGVTVSSPAFTVRSLSTLPATLGMYDSLGLEVGFAPADTSAFNGEIAITSNDAMHPRATIPVQGVGMRPAGPLPGILYALQIDRSEAVLHAVNAQGGVTNSVPMSMPGVHALTVSSADDQFYGIDDHPHGSTIARIDRVSGRQYPLHTLELHGVSAIGVPRADTVYVGTDTGSVYRYLPSTAAMTLIAERRGIGFSGLVPSGPGRLWASAGSPAANDTVYSIDLRSGSVVPVGRTGSFVRTNSLCRGPDGRILALVDYALLRIDTLTGAGTFQTYIPLEGLRSIAARVLVTGVEEGGETRIPLRFALEQNSPNPFNPSTKIAYEVGRTSDVRLGVYDLLGREVSLLVNERKNPGRYATEFAAVGLASGMYICRLQAGDLVLARKMVLVR